jgi:hypothetical protein
MLRALTSLAGGGAPQAGIYVANLVHCVTFQLTLKHSPGGATSAGVLKGLQAVMVFVVTSLVFCGVSVRHTA